MIPRCLVIPIAAALLLAAGAPGDVVERRGAEPPVIGSVTTIDDGGVRVRESTGLVRIVPWDRVRSLQTTFPEPRLEERLAMATDLWRARSRLERRDVALAEPIFDRWFETFRGQTSETALVVSEGLLRCLLARGAHEAAVVPALEVARLRRANASTKSYALLEPVLDEATSLCVALPPVWVQPRALARLERDLAHYDAGGDEVVEALASLYRAAALRQMDRDADADLTRSLPDHPGVSFLESLEQAWGADPDVRGRARARLLAPDGDRPTWIEAWSRLGAGLSLLAESDPDMIQRGLVTLAHVPARFGASHPYLAGIALGRMAEALDAAGESNAAARLRAELARRYPRHPIRELEHLTRADRAAPRRRETS